MIFFSILFSIISLFMIVSFVAWQVLKYKTILPAGYGMLFLLCGYALFPIYYLLGYINIERHYRYNMENESLYIVYLMACILIFIFLLSFFLGYSITQKNQYKISTNPFKKIYFFKYFFVILVISTVAYSLYIYIYGGLSYILENISHIRSGKDEHKNYLGALLNMFAGYYVFLLYSLFAYILILKNKMHFKKYFFKKIILFFILFLIFVIAKKFLDGGRGGVIAVFIGLALISSLYLKKINKKYIFILFFISIFVILFGKTILFQLFVTGDFASPTFNIIDLWGKVLGEFTHLYISIVNALEKELGADRLFGDFIYWALKPLKLLGVEGVDSISYYNTYQILGLWESNIPPGMVAFLYIEGGVIFIPLGGFFIGMFFISFS